MWKALFYTNVIPTGALNLLHAAPQLMLAHIRERWWPLNGRNLARKTVRQCVKCARMVGETLKPIMGNLPSERLQSGFPFLNCGVDYVGPFFYFKSKGQRIKVGEVLPLSLCVFRYTSLAPRASYQFNFRRLLISP